MGEVWLAFLGWFFGAVATIAIAMWVERLRSPKLKLSMEPPFSLGPRGPINARLLSLRLRVSNQTLPSWANFWLVRSPAQQCRAEITFHRLDGTLVFDIAMPGRWVSAPEPVVLWDGVISPVIANPQVLGATVEIFPGETELLDVAVRVDGETSCFGWNDATYFHPNWRNPDWMLLPSVYLINATIRSSGRKTDQCFRLANDGGTLGTFRLIPASEEDRRAIQKNNDPPRGTENAP
jgi:hypothetical protein